MTPELSRYERTILLNFWPGGLYPEGVAEEVVQLRSIQTQLGIPGPVRMENMIELIRRYQDMPVPEPEHKPLVRKLKRNLDLVTK